ncbi:MAG: asparagine synthase (glutamine-hydrolyzing) [Solirubrobacteraceae bacterium]
MCGICGLLALDGAGPVDADALDAMNATMVHRGPDSAGAFVDGSVGLAARRLAIIDLEHGDQPLSNEDGTVTVVQNGEIYNHEALHAELEAAGHRFRTRSDTEVLAHAYEEWGIGFVERLRGMFALALWDARERRLVLARDRFGIKPLFWAEPGGALAFASELKALRLAPGFREDVDPEALDAFLAFNSIPAPLTIYAGARKLPPGHVLVGQRGAIRIERFARPRPVPAADVRREDEATLAAELRETLRDSVRAHLISDVPVGVLLSGGVDSSLLCALAAQESSEPVQTFSIGFQERSYDELDLARSVAERYRTDHQELILKPDAAELFPEIAAAFDEPLGDSSALPTFLVCRLASEHVKVAMSGEGGDELFGGYETYVADLLSARGLGRAARVARPLVELLPSSSRRVSLEYRAKRFVRAAHLPPLERHHGWKEIFARDVRAELLRGRRDGYDPLDVYRERYAETAGAEPLARLQDVDLGIYLVDDLLVKTDRMSMAHSLEARVPYLDTEVAGLAMALPTTAKVRGWAKKRLLRRAAAPLLPEAIVRGRKKGFSIPAAAWLRGPLVPFAREVLAPARIADQGLLDPAAVTAVLDRHVDGREDLSRQLWGLLALSLWQDRRPVRPGPAPGR